MKVNKALAQQRQLEKDYKNFKTLNGEDSYPFDAFFSGFNYGIKYEKMSVKNRTKQSKTKKKK